MTGTPHRPFWSLIDEAARTELAGAGRTARFAQGAEIVRQHERSDHLLVIREGCVKVVVESEIGYQAVLALRGPGDLLGEQAGLDGGARSAAVHALAPVEVLLIPLSRFGAAQRAHPSIVQAVQHVLSGRLRDADIQRAATGSEAVRKRLAVLLLSLAEQYGHRAGPTEVRIMLPLSQDDLAGLVLTSRRTVSRILEQWRGEGWLVTGRFLIRLLRTDLLRELASADDRSRPAGRPGASRGADGPPAPGRP
ncbi:Crp/Fnr family transcriptional regulator [Kitasatospora indigofera]|uniref:Crp/Fnr family transcriptional regulator n=1 Tax=Kitasatospora indigofera TaxID=67307 RepID=UPI00363DAABF